MEQSKYAHQALLRKLSAGEPCTIRASDDEVELPEHENCYVSNAIYLLENVVHNEKALLAFEAALCQYALAEGDKVWGHEPKTWPRNILDLVLLGAPPANELDACGSAWADADITRNLLAAATSK